MRTFVIAVENARLLAGIDSFQTTGALPTPGVRPSDPENAALYDEVVRTIAAINAELDKWRTQAAAEGQAAYLAQQNMSTP